MLKDINTDVFLQTEIECVKNMYRKLLNSELGRISVDDYKHLPESAIAVVLDNVRSRHNIGSAFRTCDGFGITRMVLCGISSVPPSPEIHKSALGAEFSVNWEYAQETAEAVTNLKKEGYTVIGIEQTENSVCLDEFLDGTKTLSAEGKYAVVFGNEVHGIAQEVIDLCDFTVEIAQYGTKHSLNVSVTVGIVLYILKHCLSAN